MTIDMIIKSINGFPIEEWKTFIINKKYSMIATNKVTSETIQIGMDLGLIDYFKVNKEQIK